MKSLNNGRIWPYAIGGAIVMVFGFCVTTVVVTSKADIQTSDAYMTNYQDADKRANELIKQRLAFDKKYNVSLVQHSIGSTNPVLAYKVTTKDGVAVNDANIVVAISRPETKEFDMKLTSPKVSNGIYTFENAKFPKAGIWNIIAKVSVGNTTRFYNIKADTRDTKIKEF